MVGKLHHVQQLSGTLQKWKGKDPGKATEWTMVTGRNAIPETGYPYTVYDNLLSPKKVPFAEEKKYKSLNM